MREGRGVWRSRGLTVWDQERTIILSCWDIWWPVLSFFTLDTGFKSPQDDYGSTNAGRPIVNWNTQDNWLFQKSQFSLRSRRLEVVGERENGRARGRHACPLLQSACYAGYQSQFFRTFCFVNSTRYVYHPNARSARLKFVVTVMEENVDHAHCGFWYVQKVWGWGGMWLSLVNWKYYYSSIQMVAHWYVWLLILVYSLLYMYIINFGSIFFFFQIYIVLVTSI